MDASADFGANGPHLVESMIYSSIYWAIASEFDNGCSEITGKYPYWNV